MKELLLFEPVRKELIWGSESWVIGAHPSGDCRVTAGTYAGSTLSQLWDEHRELFHDARGDRFPFLVKIIDAKKDLSIQVHPGDAYAKQHENGSLGKAECWYILHAVESKTLILGHHAKSREEAEEMIRDERWDEFLKRVTIKEGNFVQINPGTIHSICGGTKLIEIQQNSDITYRLYDYGRIVNGKPRELHIGKSLDVISIPDRSEERIYPEIPKDGHVTDFYKVIPHRIETEQSFVQDEDFQVLCVADGAGEIDGHPIRQGDALIIPYGYGTYTVAGQIEILITSL